MKSLKLFGVAVIAALALSVIAGAGSASATLLCGVPASGECPAGSIYPNGSILKAHSTNLKVVAFTGIEPMTCSSSDIEIETEGSHEGKPLAGQLKSFTLQSCKESGCFPVAMNARLPYNTSMQATGSGTDGTLSVTNGGKGNPGIELQYCYGQNYSCVYGASKLELSVGSGVTNRFELKSTTMTKESGPAKYCPESLTISATYYTGDPKFNGSTSKSTIKGELAGEPFESSCASSIGGTEMQAAAGSISSLSFSGCTGWCQSAKALNLPYGTSYMTTEGASSTLTVPNFKVEFSCTSYGFPITAIYSGSVTLDVKAGYPLPLVASEEPLKRTGGSSLSPENVKWSGTYNVTGSGGSSQFWML